MFGAPWLQDVRCAWRAIQSKLTIDQPVHLHRTVGLSSAYRPYQTGLAYRLEDRKVIVRREVSRVAGALAAASDFGLEAFLSDLQCRAELELVREYRVEGNSCCVRVAV